ncbi:MAG: hypothetical protein ABJO67_05395 [Pseudoruegeria sp.]
MDIFTKIQPKSTVTTSSSVDKSDAAGSKSAKNKIEKQRVIRKVNSDDGFILVSVLGFLLLITTISVVALDRSINSARLIKKIQAQIEEDSRKQIAKYELKSKLFFTDQADDSSHNIPTDGSLIDLHLGGKSYSLRLYDIDAIPNLKAPNSSFQSAFYDLEQINTEARVTFQNKLKISHYWSVEQICMYFEKLIDCWVEHPFTTFAHRNKVNIRNVPRQYRDNANKLPRLMKHNAPIITYLIDGL